MSDMAIEAAIYWRSARTLVALRLLPQLTPALQARADDAASDLEVVAMHSDWPRLRIAAKKALEGSPSVRATG